VAILYVSHQLEEVKRLSHWITILRDGRLVMTQKTADLSANEIVRLMVGRSLQDLFPKKVPPAKQTNVLEVRNLSVPGFVTDASFIVGKGEILGFAGLTRGRTHGIMGGCSGFAKCLRRQNIQRWAGDSVTQLFASSATPSHGLPF
jgi:ribose transport system ATP-binding protein